METQNCYIRIVNDKPFEHPIVESNLAQIVRDFDPENLPEGIEKFIRHAPPEQIGFLETFVGSTYQKIDGVWQDVHEVRPLSEDEKNAKIKFMKDHFPFTSWTLNETTGEWISPVPLPDDNNLYTWDEDNKQWIDIDQIETK